MNANPTLGEILIHDGRDPVDLPDTNHPYFLLAKNGLFMHRRTAQGRGVVPTRAVPAALKPLSATLGQFDFDGPEVPAEIYAQAVHFFRRIFEKHHTEAEVILTQNQTTKAYRLFVPTQRVSHGGVYSIYNPAHIDPAYMTVGTFHSHCDFSPGHSSTDEGDARDMDGLHGTIGYIDRETPEMALMYALSKSFFHFASPFTGIVDTSNLDAAKAPEWWDRYVILGQVTDAQRPDWASNEDWDRYMGRSKKPKAPVQAPHQLTPATTTPSPWLPKSGAVYTSHRPSIWQGAPERITQLAPDEPKTWLGDGIADEAYFDDLLYNGVISWEELEAVGDSFTSAKEERNYWELEVLSKVEAAVSWLSDQGFDLTISSRGDTTNGSL